MRREAFGIFGCKGHQKEKGRCAYAGEPGRRIAQRKKRLKEISQQMGEPDIARDATRLIQLNDDYQETETKLQSLYAEWDRVAADAPKV